jgi:hypothetical protein
MTATIQVVAAPSFSAVTMTCAGPLMAHPAATVHARMDERPVIVPHRHPDRPAATPHHLWRTILASVR